MHSFLYTLDTTDIQNLTAEADITTAKITCHFATGTLCKGCVVKWWEITADGKSLSNGELNISRIVDSLTATDTIRGLIPSRTYSLVGYDLESDNTISNISITRSFTTVEGK